ncbi:hypothetical protein IFM89_017429 [Coptis chinensis]|uniref:Agenet-like domain-containing protein n=1 Tax=Coptis chinensis TaxID=261450 RepID=A0A835LFI8_9MAGN|nr:hypothetical protein IFM89_017429 [Coptis chinensis]
MEDNQTSEQWFFEEGNSAPSSSALKRKAAEPSFTNGTQVEVSLPDKHCCGAWFPATVFKKTKSDSFLVQCNSLRLSVAAGLLRDIVHAKHIRPSLPENFRGIPFYVADKDINQNKGGVAGCQSIKNVSEGVSTDNQHASQLCMAITSTEAPTKGNEVQEAMCLKEDKNTGDQCHNALENGDNEIVMAALLNDHNSNLNVLENESLPFIKCSPGWKDVESNEIFRSMPQKPHFLPLQKKLELLREGKALGLMVSFGSLVEKISKTHYDEPKSILEDNEHS